MAAHPRIETSSEISWPEREQYWQRRLGRIRLGAEPVEVQLERYRRVTWALTLVPLALAVFMIVLFTAFRRPDVGVVLGAALFVPVVVIAWLDYGRLRRRVAEYLAERERFAAGTNNGDEH